MSLRSLRDVPIGPALDYAVPIFLAPLAVNPLRTLLVTGEEGAGKSTSGSSSSSVPVGATRRIPSPWWMPTRRSGPPASERASKARDFRSKLDLGVGARFVANRPPSSLFPWAGPILDHTFFFRDSTGLCSNSISHRELIQWIRGQSHLLALWAVLYERYNWLVHWPDLVGSIVRNREPSGR
jgi:hypothetical protein